MKTSILIFIFSGLVFAQEIKIKELQSNAYRSISKNSEEGRIFMFFKENCPVCLRQSRNLDCLSSSQKERVFFVALGGAQESLWREWNKWNIGWGKPYIADNEVLKFFRIKNNNSPQWRILSPKGEMKTAKGFVLCQKLRGYL